MKIKILVNNNRKIIAASKMIKKKFYDKIEKY